MIARDYASSAITLHKGRYLGEDQGYRYQRRVVDFSPYVSVGNSYAIKLR